MAQQKRKFLDEAARRLRGILDDLDRSLDRLMNPRPQPKPVRVPIPVRPQRPPQDPYR
ncbi:MAG: hypothetical protein SF162_07145 [bacterium]|nr:hypothetical protein [bacterium]